MRFEPSELSEQELALQREVREFLAAELPRGTFEPGLGMDAPRDKQWMHLDDDPRPSHPDTRPRARSCDRARPRSCLNGNQLIN